VKFSLWPRNDRPPADLLAEVRTADADGWYGVWLADHYMPNTGDTTPARGDAYECWALLPALAAVTERVRIGTLVSPTSVHHPALLAKRASTLDQLSGGRMVLGLGAGWQINEHHAYGIELEPPGKRVSRFDESIQIVRSMLSADSTTFHGAYYDITDAPCDPKPVQSPLPLLVGTRSPRMLRITARHADEWNAWGTAEDFRRRTEVLADHCAAVGRDLASIARSTQALVYLSTDETWLAPRRADESNRARLLGTPAELVDQVGAYDAAGVDELIVPDWMMGSPSRTADTLDLFWNEVAVHFR